MDWIKKYEPQTFQDIILNSKVRRRLESILSRPKNVILSGPPGIGKGTFTNVFLKHTGYDKLWFDASEVNIEDIRKEIKGYANTFGFMTNKAVVINEADSMKTIHQNPFKEIIEKAIRTIFIFMTNDIAIIGKAIKSRCIIIDFESPTKDDIIAHMEKILNSEGISNPDKERVSRLVNKHYPDIRGTINYLESKFAV